MVSAKNSIPATMLLIEILLPTVCLSVLVQGGTTRDRPLIISTLFYRGACSGGATSIHTPLGARSRLDCAHHCGFSRQCVMFSHISGCLLYSRSIKTGTSGKYCLVKGQADSATKGAAHGYGGTEQLTKCNKTIETVVDVSSEVGVSCDRTHCKSWYFYYTTLAMIFSGGPVNIPCLPLGQCMTERFDQFGDREALVDPTTGRSLTFRELSDTVRRCARGLSSLGFKKGDVLCMFSPNVLEYPVLFYAVASLGGVLQTTNPYYVSSELRHTLDLCKPKLLVTVPSLLPTVREAEWTGLVVTLGRAAGCINFSTLTNKRISSEPIPDPGINPKEDVVTLLFSSGTTGKPKAVQSTHFGVIANALQLVDSMDTTANDVFVTILPFFHVYALGPVTTSGLYAGAKSVIMPRFEPRAYLNNIQKYRATMLHTVPPVLVVLSSFPDIHQYNLRSVNKVMSGAAPLSKEIEAKTCKIFGIEHISQGYGLTECPTTHAIRADNFRFGSVGTLLKGMECKIMDVNATRILPPGTDGEIYIRGPSVMKGYLNNPRATSAMIDNDGWMRTGDIGHVDSDGFMFVVDRIKELIKFKGFQVAPADLEDILLKHPDVADVGVIGVPDVEAGELPKAFVVRKASSNVSEQELVEFVASKVSATKRLRGGVTFLSEIPKSPSGKILRRILRDRERTRAKL